MYKKIGNIDSLNEIPWDKPVIITGEIDRNHAWFYRMAGMFKRDNECLRFVDDFGMSTRFNNNDSISLSILEKSM